MDGKRVPRFRLSRRHPAHCAEPWNGTRSLADGALVIVLDLPVAGSSSLVEAAAVLDLHQAHGVDTLGLLDMDGAA